MRYGLKWLGIAVLAFGVGVLLAFFMPISVMIVLEAAVIIVIGLLFLRDRWR